LGGPNERRNQLWFEPGAANSPSAPQRPNNYFRLVEGVVEMTSDLRDVQPTEARDSAGQVGCAGAREEREDPKSLLELGGKDSRVDPVLNPPRLLAMDVPAGCCGEPDSARSQRERSSLRTTSASTSRPAATSASDSRRAWCNAARSVSSSQSPGSSGSSSTSAPSGRSVGSSSTRRPARTQALIVIASSVALQGPPNKCFQPTPPASALGAARLKLVAGYLLNARRAISTSDGDTR